MSHTRRRGAPPFHGPVEALEPRCVLSTTGLSSFVATPTLTVLPAASVGVPTGETASQVSQAYGLTSSTGAPQITFNQNGTTVAGNGAGETIAIVDAYNDPTIVDDLAQFDQAMGLPAANLQVVNESGTTINPGGAYNSTTNPVPSTDPGWALEISLDVEWAHAIAPGAKILLVEANSGGGTDLVNAIKYASGHANVVSMSWGGNEFSGESYYDSLFSGANGVTFVAASGDDGGANGPMWPAVSSNVLAVGGTTLNSTSGTYSGESAWSGSNGGFSQQYYTYSWWYGYQLKTLESEPSYQQSVQTTGSRATPDVSYDANPDTGFAVYDSTPDGGQSGWFQVGGTSAGSPQWAALIAIADQGRALAKESPVGNGPTAIYGLYAQPNGPSAFHDVTTGSNANYSAGKGWDPVTGLGTPVARLLVMGLINPSSLSPASVPSATAVHTSSTTTTAAFRAAVAAATSSVAATVPTTLSSGSGSVLASAAGSTTTASAANAVTTSQAIAAIVPAPATGVRSGQASTGTGLGTVGSPALNPVPQPFLRGYLGVEGSPLEDEEAALDRAILDWGLPAEPTLIPGADLERLAPPLEVPPDGGAWLPSPGGSLLGPAARSATDAWQGLLPSVLRIEATSEVSAHSAVLAGLAVAGGFWGVRRYRARRRKKSGS